MTEIDVSVCEGYKDKHCRYNTSIMFTEGNLCSNFPDCHYRQLKRLEQENEKLKEGLEEIKEVFKKYDSEEEGTVAELLHDVFEAYGRVCEVLKDE